MIHLFAFIIGCCIGSFINVIFSRSDWHKGRSRCDACGYTLKWYDMIPIISYVFLRGKCRKCGKKIEKSHIISELIMGAAFLCSSFYMEQYGMVQGVICFVSLFFIAIAAIEDYKEQMVYSLILYTGQTAVFLCTFIQYIFLEKYTGVIIFACLVLASKIIFMLLSKIFKNQIGSGDFDVLLIILMLCGVYGMFVSLTAGCIIGCFVYYPPIIIKKQVKTQPIAFIPLLFIGALLYIALEWSVIF